MKTAPFERFIRHIKFARVDCWEWTASTRADGYAQFNDGTTMVLAHRWSYRHYTGPIVAGMDIDHLCRNRACVNPDHLEMVTRGENLRRGYAARGLKTSCAHGHPFDDDNTFQRPNGGRGCRTCRNNASRTSKAQHRAQQKGTPQ